MNSSFEKYIKAAMDSHQYSVVCEMANVIYPEKNKINMMTYPGKDVRIYKNREDEVQILCPNDITFTQESNITKAISTGTIFEDADEVDKYAGFIVKTKMPVDAMTNKGLENPYKIKEMVGSTIGVMDEDGEVDVSDTDVDNGNNVIDDLLKKDSKEFKDVKNVVDDYLGNDSHEFGYDKDFTADIQQLRDEINNFKDADISPEDSITDDDWDDNWGSATSIMGDHNDAEDERDSDDEPSKAEDNLDVADDDDEDEKNEDDELTQEACSIYLEMLADEPMEYQFTQEEYEILQEMQYFQEGVFKSLKKIGYNPMTRTFVTDIPVKNGKPGEKMKCKVAINSIISIMNGPCFTVPPATPEPTLHIPLKYMIGNTDKLMGIIKHEEGHYYVSLNRDDMKDEFDKAGELVCTYGPEMSDHGNFPEEYIADTYSAKHTDDSAEGLVKFLEDAGKKNHKNVVKVIALFKASAGIVKVIFKILRSGEKTKLFGKTIKEHIKQLSNNYKSSDDITKRLIAGYTKLGLTLSKGPGQYSKALLINDKSRVKSDIHNEYFEKMQKYIDDFGKDVDKLEDIEDEITGEVELDLYEQRCLKGIEKAIKLFQEFDEATLKEYEVRIKNIRDKNNGMIKEYVTESAKPVPEYKTRKPLSLTHFLEIDDTANHDSSDVDYKADEESNTAELSKKPSNGDNINTTMEEDTTTPMPMFSAGPEMQTESNEPTEDDDTPEYKVKFVKSKGNLRDTDNNAEECLAKLKELVHGDIPEDYIEGIMNAEAKDLMNKYSNGIIEVPDFDEFIVSGLCPIDEVIDYNESMPDRFSDDCSVFIVGTSDYDMRFIVLDTNDGKYYLVYMDHRGSDGFFKYPIASSFKELIEVLEKAKALDDERWNELINQSKEKVGESVSPKGVVPDDLNAAPSDGHNPLLDPIHEGFMLKRPKKLKAIDVRGIASYVTVEMNAIKDSNDQAMLAGYVCSKLELIDFYLTVIDTNDDRYIVPHSRQYLVDGQRQLSDLLTKILRIRPINKSSRIWQIEKI